MVVAPGGLDAFVEPKFALIFPAQRFHYLSHLIPADYQHRYLADTVWFELAPGESPDDLRHPDPDLIDEISDCEILFNVEETSRLAARYWKARAEGRKPYDPHEAG